MKRLILAISLILLAISFTACSKAPDTASSDTAEAVSLKSGTEDSNYVELNKIKEHVWVHTTYGNYNGSRTPSNGLLVETSEGLVLIDTPWNKEQTKELIKLAESSFKKDIIHAFMTHAHVDRIGGIDVLLEKRIEVNCTNLTAQLAEKQGYQKPNPNLNTENTQVRINDTNFELFYPGPGHTIDNIVIWLPGYKVLFGGCIIKSMDSKTLGNTDDADTNHWPASLNKLMERYPDAEAVIPGHGQWGGVELIKHTLELAENYPITKNP